MKERHFSSIGQKINILSDEYTALRIRPRPN